jgi:hypothetical protein
LRRVATLVTRTESPQVVLEAVTPEVQQRGGLVRVDRFGQASGAIAREAWRRPWLLRIPPPPQFERQPGDDLRPIPRPTADTSQSAQSLDQSACAGAHGPCWCWWLPAVPVRAVV